MANTPEVTVDRPWKRDDERVRIVNIDKPGLSVRLQVDGSTTKQWEEGKEVRDHWIAAANACDKINPEALADLLEACRKIQNLILFSGEGGVVGCYNKNFSVTPWLAVPEIMGFVDAVKNVVRR